jgi:thioredoxin-dependent peroxiredoxin
MRLKPGQTAPHFLVKDIYGRRVDLADFRGAKLLLSFYRAAVCPLCNIRTWHLIDRYPEYQRHGMRHIAFYESSPLQTHHYLDRLRAPFPVVADLDRVVYAQYGLEWSLWGALYARLTRGAVYREATAKRLGGTTIQSVTQARRAFGRLPADFLIGPDLRIRSVYYGKDAGDFLRFSEIDRFVASA